ncbi:MAG TPA: YtxH domain-containing protein [Anaerolineales bacterium]|nr:YtxH domain-containing protein [Anaerolineales bacterium]
MSDHDEFGAFLVGFIVGGVTGAIAALLMAPQSGVETRAIIHDRSIELKDTALAEAEKAKVKIQEGSVAARSKVEEISKTAYTKGEEIAHKAKVSGQELLDAAKTKVSKSKTDPTTGEVEIPTEA